MNLDYQEIMELPEPRDGADVGTMESICGVYAQLAQKITRLLDEALQQKICWMQQERIDLYAKRLAANQRELRCKERQRRQGEMFNFCLRVREWVLSNPARRLRLRALIGENRIAKWQDRRLAYKNRAGRTPTPTKHSKVAGGKTARQYEVRNWYRLPSVSQDINTRSAKLPRLDMRHLNINHLNMNHLNMDHIRSGLKPTPKQRPLTPAARGMCRAMPAVVFWPDELAADYVHPQAQITPEKPTSKHPVRMVTAEEHQEKVRLSNLLAAQIGATTAKEWPD